MTSENLNNLAEQKTLMPSTVGTGNDANGAAVAAPLAEAEKQPVGRRGGLLMKGFSRFKSEIVFALLTLILTLGQYYQSGYATRIGITQIWKEGYNAETRNHVARFTLHYRRWQQNPDAAARSLDILVKPEYVLDGEIVRADNNLKTLIDSEFGDNGKGRTPKQYSDAALGYRNAILECLNTLEAVTAVIKARPSWVSRLLGNGDLLEERYEDLIEQRTNELLPFIRRYRADNPRRTPVWVLLTPGEQGGEH